MSEWEEQDLQEYLHTYTAVTIPVHSTIDAKHQIIDMGNVKEILLNAKVISVQPCWCRETLKNCDNPLEVCLMFNETAENAIENWGATHISLDKALAILDMSHKAGLVHMAYYKKGKDCEIICSCCSCCCHHLSALMRFGYHNAVVKSDYIAHFDAELCNECGTCVERCQFEAWIHQKNGVALDADSCFGCGLCVSTCPTGAVTLEKR
ncbi:MAG: 4Fe-4S binding protein [Candidatus Methanofastidiosia archaeon]|jgi:hypothetical protein